VEAKGHHDSLQGTPMCQQGEHEADRLGWGTQPVEGRPVRRREGLAALCADEALLFARMNANVALTCLTSGWAVKIGTKCGSEVHASPPGIDLAFAKSMAGPPLFLQIRVTTV